MIGLFYIGATALLCLLFLGVYRAAKKWSPAMAHMFAGLIVLTIVWYFHGYRLSHSYSEFLRLCEHGREPVVVRTSPTDVPYSRYCETAQAMVLYGPYAAVECEVTYEQPRQRRLIFKGKENPGCLIGRENDIVSKECFDIAGISMIAAPYTDRFERKRIKSDALLLGELWSVKDVYYSGSDGSELGYTQNYEFLPRSGTDTLLRGSSGHPTSIGCPPRNMSYARFISRMFPPIPGGVSVDRDATNSASRGETSASDGGRSGSR